MKTKFIFSNPAPFFPLIIFLMLPFLLISQSNVRAWESDGQLWIVWKLGNDIPEKIRILKSAELSDNAEDWVQIGSLFPELVVPYALRLHIDEASTFIIPDGNGGSYTLKKDEGVFVETIRTSETLNYAINYCFATYCVEEINASHTIEEVQVIFSESNKVKPHLQVETSFGNDQLIKIYYLWTEGKSNHKDGLQDFPIMGNQYTNGWPHLFSMWTGPNADLTEPSPGAIWLHGGSGNFSQFFPYKRKEININVNEGILISHNDDFMRYVDGEIVKNESNSWWFGWSNNHNPFEKFYSGPQEGDSIINYSQRRLKWVNDWLVEQGLIDPNRISINGYSVGSAGTIAMVKNFPTLFSAACLFSCGHRGPDVANFGSLLLGTDVQNLPTNIKDQYGGTLGIHDMYDLENKTTFEDWPIIRAWHGKNDKNPTMQWSPSFLNRITNADSVGLGYQLFWDERDHPINNINVHWTHGPEDSIQTEKDNTAYNEKYRNDISYPVFYNYRKYDIENNDPGNGERGTGMGNGDDWGTWGGYHEFDLESLVDSNNFWSAVIYLSGENSREIDQYHGDEDCIKTDITVRRLQNFKLAPLENFNWTLSDADGNIIDQGNNIADSEGRPVIEGLVSCRDPKQAKITLERASIFGCGEMINIENKPGTYCESINIDGVEREFIVIVPDNYDGSEAFSLILAFHGGGGNMSNFAFGHINPNGGGREEFIEKAAENKMILVYPQALIHPAMGKTSWNIFDQDNSYADDLGMVENILSYVNSRLNIDESKLYAVGYSRGGDFAQFIGRNMSCTFAAVASVGSSSGTAIDPLDTAIYFHPKSEHPIPVLMIKGDRDNKRPWLGGVNNNGFYTPSGIQDFDQWLDNNGCDTEQSIQVEIGPEIGLEYRNIACEGDAPVIMIRGFNLAHVWPDLDESVGINANELFIEFFKGKVNSNDCITNTQEADINMLQVFPNPTSDWIIFKSNMEYGPQFKIYDNLGNKVQEFTLKDSFTRRIDISSLKSGVYYIITYSKNKMLHSRFIKI